MIRKIIYCLLLFLILADVGYSFLQHLGQPLDGDMASHILPAKELQPIFNSPFGLQVILKHQTYPNPNRFFCHWMLKEYFNVAPLLLQKVVHPIESIYLSCAITKILIQIILIYLLALLITGTRNILRMDFILAALLVTPFFQTNGYRSYMGIIDPSITYTFFYALPCALLLLYFLPFINQIYNDKKPSAQLLINILWIPFAVIISLSGALNPGVVLIFSMLLILMNVRNNFQHINLNGNVKKLFISVVSIPKNYWFYLVPISIFSLYSLFIGTYNSNNTKVPLVELYSRLPEGIYYQVTQKLGFPVLLMILLINTILISIRYKNIQGKKILNLFKWVGVFSLIYILLLPLGGYRIYRPNICRYDTIMPITLCLIFIFGNSTLFLLKSLSFNQKIWYIPLIAGVLFIFTYADKPDFDNNQCEKNALKIISESKEPIVKLTNDCPVFSWEKITKPEDSELSALLLYNWGVTKEKKLYFNQ